jgi:hypothetical protein
MQSVHRIRVESQSEESIIASAPIVPTTIIIDNALLLPFTVLLDGAVRTMLTADDDGDDDKIEQDGDLIPNRPPTQRMIPVADPQTRSYHHYLSAS